MGNNIMDNDGGYFAIKGFLFQFDKQIIEILENPDKIINVERSQDIDYDDYYIQVKCHEKTKYSPSRLRKPIIQLIEKHKSNSSAKVCLYCHFFDKEPEKKVVDISYLEEILGDEKTKYSSAEKQSFIQIFILEFCGNYAEQFDQVIRLIDEKFKCLGNDIVYIYHSIIRNHVLNLVVRKEKEERKVSFSDFRNVIDSSVYKVTLHGYLLYLNEERYIRLLRKQYFVAKTSNINNFERLFIVEIDCINHSNIESLITYVSNKFYVKNKSPLPYVCFRGISRHQLVESKRLLLDHGVRFTDGTFFDGDKFRLNEIIQKSFPREYAIKIIEEENIGLLLDNLPVQEIYQFYHGSPLFIGNEVDKHIFIQYGSIAQVLKMLQ